MPTILGDRFGSGFLGRPPHMSTHDELIWRRWWPFNNAGVVAVYFDVGLGLPLDLPARLSPNEAFMWIRINQKRADAVIDYAERVLIVEMRHAASLNAVGRLQGYLMLWKQDPVIGKPVEGLVVTDRFDAEVMDLADSVGLDYVTV